jgi:hypothetical protein
MAKANVVAVTTEEIVPKKKKLELIPNEVIGLRIRPDNYNWAVVVVKVRGVNSKEAGQQYEEDLPAFCKSLEHAVEVIFNRVALTEGRRLQDEEFKKSGLCCDLEVLKTAFVKAQEAAIVAVKELEDRLKDAGINLKDLPKIMGKPPEVTQEEAE